MSLQAAQIPGVLGTALDGFWLTGAAARRQVSCVTVVRQRQECRQCRFGELAVLTRDAGPLSDIEDAITSAGEHQVAAILVPDAPFSHREHARLRALADTCEVAVGLLGVHVDPVLAAN